MGDRVWLRFDFPSSITSYEVVRVRLPLREPFVASHGAVHDREVVLLRLVAGAEDAWGECSTLSEPTYVAETTDDAWSLLTTSLGQSLLGHRGKESVWELKDRGATLAAVDVALRGLAGDDGSPARSSVASTAVVGQRASIDELLAVVDREVADGYRSVKLKIGPGWDVEPLRAVRSAWPSLAVAVDANGAYPPGDEDAWHALRALDELQLFYLEQPLPADALPAIAELRGRIGTPIALDESIRSWRDLRAALDVGAIDVLNVKLARLGGFGAAVELARLACEAGVGCFVGGMLETGVGRSAALRLAARSEFELPTDLGPSARYFVDDLTEPIGWALPGEVAVPQGPPFARPPRPDRLAAVTVDRYEGLPWNGE
jgi:O-succinylbenzoate synthase